MLTTDYFPIGGILPFGSEIANSKMWLPCEGQELDKNIYPELFDKIGHTYGGKDDLFKVPDYRGYFHRGVSGKTGKDPDSGTRRRIQNNEFSGIIDELVGTIQDFATKKPLKDFQGNVPHLPTANISVSGETSHDGAAADGNYTGATCTSGGDAETRPINMNVNYYIKARN